MTKMSKRYELYDLTCNYRHSPLGICCSTPGFSWKIRSLDHSWGGTEQTGYVLRLIDAEGKIIWNSGRVESSQHQQIIYPGQLQPHSAYSWQVCIWDNLGECSGWSAPQRFLTGLRQQDWQGVWITYDGIVGIDSFHDHVWLRRTVEFSEKPLEGILYVASLGLHDVYVNGKKASQNVLNPHRSSLRENRLAVNYVTYDISKFLHQGKNILGIAMDAGYTRMMKLKPALLVQLHTEQGILCSDEQWRCRANGNRYPGGFQWGDYGGEETVYPASETFWSTIEQEDGHWNNVRSTNVDCCLIPQQAEADRIIHVLKPVKITQTDSCVVDMGENYSGWFALRLPKLEQPVRIEVSDKVGETCTFGQKITYLPGMKHGGWYCSQFNHISGRFFTITGLPVPLRASDVQGFMISSLPERTGNFSCSDQQINRIFEADMRTFTANTLGGVTADCPHRERLGYGETAVSTTWGDGLPWYNAGAIYWNYFKTWIHTQRQDGYIGHTAPDFLGGGGTAWSNYPIVGLNDYLQYFEDENLAKWMYPGICHWLQYLEAHKQNGILQRYEHGEWDFLGDWATPDGDDWGNSEEALYFNNCCYAAALYQCAQLAKELNYQQDAANFSQQHKQLASAIGRRYLLQNGLYCKADARYQAVALWGHIVPEETRQALWNAMLRIITDKGYVDGGSAGMTILLRMLTQYPSGNKAVFSWLQRKTVPSFGAFLEAGETTWPEMWDMRDIYGASRIHTCYTGCAGWLARGLAGIMVSREQIIIKPFFPHELQWLSCTVQSSCGLVSCKWRREEGSIYFTVQIPFGASARLETGNMVRQMHHGTHEFKFLVK